MTDQDDYQHILNLYEDLDTFRFRRFRFAILWFMLIVMMPLFMVLGFRLFRYSGLLAIVVVGFLALLWLIDRTIKNEQLGTRLKQEVRRLKLEYQFGVRPEKAKRKRRDSTYNEDDADYYDIGADGELISLDDVLDDDDLSEADDETYLSNRHQRHTT